MGSVSVNKNVSIHLDKNEKEILTKSYEIMKELRHELFLKDDDSDIYWCIDGTMMGLKDILNNTGGSN